VSTYKAVYHIFKYLASFNGVPSFHASDRTRLRFQTAFHAGTSRTFRHVPARLLFRSTLRNLVLLVPRRSHPHLKLRQIWKKEVCTVGCLLCEVSIIVKCDVRMRIIIMALRVETQLPRYVPLTYQYGNVNSTHTTVN
jgi:hypothetical protein